jgi:hypothetical protein
MARTERQLEVGGIDTRDWESLRAREADRDLSVVAQAGGGLATAASVQTKMDGQESVPIADQEVDSMGSNHTNLGAHTPVGRVNVVFESDWVGPGGSYHEDLMN